MYGELVSRASMQSIYNRILNQISHTANIKIEMQFKNCSMIITINKSQGQLLNTKIKFNNGMNYTCIFLSRSENPENQNILIPQSSKIKNIMYLEVL